MLSKRGGPAKRLCRKQSNFVFDEKMNHCFNTLMWHILIMTVQMLTKLREL